jgi:hypothetical protein
MISIRACPFASLRVGALRASLRSVLRTLRPSMHLTQKTYTPRVKYHLFFKALAACRAAKRWRSHERSETRKAAAAKPQRPNDYS